MEIEGIRSVISTLLITQISDNKYINTLLIPDDVVLIENSENSLQKSIKF